MNKRKIYLPFALALVTVGCSASQEEFLVVGNTLPSGATSGVCTYAPALLPFSEGTVYLEWQKALVSPPAQQLHYVMALTLQNSLTIQPLSDSNGHTYTTSHQTDVNVTEIDATFTNVGTGPSIPDVEVVTTGYIPAGGTGVTIFDLFSAEASKTLANATQPFTLLANITVKGVTGGSSPIQSSPFQYPIEVSFAGLPVDPGTMDPCGTNTDADGNQLNILTFPNGPCGEPQDTASVACTSLTDGGA